jgi:predicted GNAT superfamily acetyltransferase
MTIRSLHTIPEFRAVMALEHEIWGYGEPEDAVGIPVFVITVKRGGILLGAYDGDRLIGFVYSLAGLKHGRPSQWSHMLGVLPAYRATGIGRDLKLAQRRIALEMGIELMEWTYDPLQTVNAHLNFRRLGVVVDEYHENVYGESSSTLHQGSPTDRFIAQWWMRSARVERAIVSPAAGPDGAALFGQIVSDAVPVLGCRVQQGTVEPMGLRTDYAGPRVLVAVPGGFTEMLERDPSRAQAWRMATREVFGHYLGHGYTVVDFAFRPGGQDGIYLLTTNAPDVQTEPRG